MLSFVQVLLIAVLILALLLLLVLFCAIDIIIDIKKIDSNLTGKIVIKWLFFSYYKMLYPQEQTIDKSKTKNGEKKETSSTENHKESKIRNDITSENSKHKSTDAKSQQSKNKEQKKGLSVKDYIQIFKDVQSPIFKFLKEISKAIRLHFGQCDLQFGLSNPSDTGMLIGILFSIFGTIRQYWRNFSYYIEPKFEGNVLNIILILDVRLRIYRFISPFFKFIFNRKILKTGWFLIRNFK